jgi:diacylglycerol kinase family enzyme
MHPEELAEGLSYLLDRAPSLPGRLVGALLVANPNAGGFTRPSYSRQRHAELLELKAGFASLPAVGGRPRLELYRTKKPAHAAEIAREFFAAARASGLRDGEFRLVMPAGGDGTSHEVLSALMDLPIEERRHYLVLRLPFGTGNDGSDGRELLASLGRLKGPCAAAPRTALLASPNPAGGKKPIWSFNIASLGADAFIAHMTNRLKNVFPGDFYKLWVDIASVFYDFLWPSRELALEAFSASGSAVRRFARPLLLLAMGASGHRQYGSNKPILPGDENVIAVSQMSLLRKLAVKGPLQRGEHRGLAEVELFSAGRLEIGYADRILFQADGEITRFGPEDFPLRMELVDDAYLTLSPAD